MTQAAIWNRFAKGYAKRPVADQASYEHKLKLTANYLSPDMTLLEVGCGTGSTALIHAPRVMHIDAFDFSDKMIEIAREKARSQGVSNVNFAVKGVDDVDGDARYDAVLAMSLLHLLPDPEGALRRLVAVLKPGGYVFSSTVCLGEMGGLIPRILPLLSITRLIPKVTSLDRSRLIAAHEDAGLTILEDFQPGPGKAIFLACQRTG